MRVIAGEAKGRKFLAPKTEGVRPTSDRVREAMFDVLAHLGGMQGRRVLDLFAGSGALGIEALSRGATRVSFVDRDRSVVETIRRNLAAVRLEHAGAVDFATSDAIAFCRRLQSAPSLPGGVSAEVARVERPGSFDITFADPPYAFEQWPKLLEVMPGQLIVLESSRAVELPPAFETYRVYRYGTTLVTVAHRRAPEDGPEDGVSSMGCNETTQAAMQIENMGQVQR